MPPARPPTPSPPDVALHHLEHLLLTQAEAPQLSREDEAARDRAWHQALRHNPRLFDGPAAACAAMTWQKPHHLALSWARVTYRHYALRRLPGNTAALPALFVAVLQPTDDGRLLLGRMSPSTAAPGCWQLPGGSVEPPTQKHTELGEAALRDHAARELAEETGINAAGEELRLWALTHSRNRNVGVLYLAPPRPADLLRSGFEAATAAEHARGAEPEFDRIAFVRSAAQLADLDGPQVDHLHPVVHRHALATELLRRRDIDQEARELLPRNGPWPTELIRRMEQIDRYNTAFLKEVVAAHGWPGYTAVGPQAADAAWLLAQHADASPDFQEHARQLLEAAVAEDDAPRRHLAYLTDRCRVAQGRPQLYGTQYYDDNDGTGLRPRPIADPDGLDARRATAGLPPHAQHHARIRGQS